MAAAFTVVEADREMLESWLRAPTVAQDLALRAKVILASAAGRGRATDGAAVGSFAQHRRGLANSATAARNSRACAPRQAPAAAEHAVRPRSGRSSCATLRKPKAATHWSARRLAKGLGLSAATVHRIWQKYGLQPHRVETFKFSRDPQFDFKLADIAGSISTRPSARWSCAWTKSRIRRSSFDRTRRLEQAIMRWLDRWNQNAKPFRWTKSAADIKRSTANVTAIYETQY